jgi:hypothetical protein
VQDQVITKSDHLVLNEQKSLVDVEGTAELVPFISSEQVDQPQRLVVFDDTAEQTQLLEAHDVAASEQMTLLDAHDIPANEIMCAEMHESTGVLKSIEVPARPSFLEADEVSKDMPSLAAQASLLDTAKVSEQMPLSASLDDNNKETDEVSKDMPSLAAQASLYDTAKVSEQISLSASLDDNDKYK